MIKSLKELKNKPSEYKYLIPEIFKELDPDKKMATTQLWLMAMPFDIGRFHSFEIVTKCLKSLTPEPKTLGELAKQYSTGTIFEVEGETYQLVGFMNNGIASRLLNSDQVLELPKNSEVRRIF
jgi:hypothetical protein